MTGLSRRTHTRTTTPYTLHPTPYTLHPTPHTPHPTPYTPYPTPYTPHQRCSSSESQMNGQFFSVCIWVDRICYCPQFPCIINTSETQRNIPDNKSCTLLSAFTLHKFTTKKQCSKHNMSSPIVGVPTNASCVIIPLMSGLSILQKLAHVIEYMLSVEAVHLCWLHRARFRSSNRKMFGY